MKKLAFVLVVVVSFLCVSCPYDGTIITVGRSIRVDVQNLLFADYEPEMEDDPFFALDRGINAKKVEISITTKEKPNEAYTASMDDTETLDPKYLYTPLVISIVEGTIKEVTATVTLESGATIVSELKDWKESSWYEGWETFENVTKFRLALRSDENDITKSVISLEPAPRGGIGVNLEWDNGKQAKENAQTDRGKAGALETNTTGNIAIQPQWLENPQGLEYAVYYAIKDYDLRELYDPTCNREGEYWDDPWEAAWTVEKLTKGTNTVAGQEIKLEPVKNGDEVKWFSATDPLSDTYSSYFFTCGATEVGKYLYIGLHIKYPETITQSGLDAERGLEAVSQVVIIPIE